MNELLQGRSSSIREVSGSRASQKAFYRFLSNESVEEKELIEACCERTGSLCAGKHILVVNDTTEVNLHAHSERLNKNSGIGVTGNNIDVGFFMHLGLAIDIEANQAIGYSSIQLYNRTEDKGTKESRGYDRLPVEQKESYKWIEGGKESKTLLGQAASITLVGDRESDLYELFTDVVDTQTHLLVRSRMNRKTEEGALLYSLLEKTEVAGTYTVTFNGDKRKQTKKRKAIVEVKHREVHIQKPAKKSKDDPRPAYVKAWLVEAKETGKQDGICWRLLTTHAINNFGEALQIVEWYQMRWWVEEVFRLLKNKGYRIEDSQLENGWAIRKLTVMLLQTILRVMQMLVAYDSDEEQDAQITFTENEISCLEKVCKREEGQTEKLKNGYPRGTLKWATWIIARLGGWSGYESQRRPGPITLKNGLDKFQSIFVGWCIALETFEIDVGTR